jgi:hypothetical protein
MATNSTYKKAIILLALINVAVLSSNNNEGDNEKRTLTIGKMLHILVTEDMIVDASFIAKVNKGEIEYKRPGQPFEQPFFDMIGAEKCDKLIDYMIDNQFVIEPGKYIINQAWPLEKIIENVRFTKDYSQKKMEIKRIVEGVIVKNFHNYVFSYDPNSVYIAGKDTVSVRHISEYDNAGNIVRFLIHKPEGPLEYSIEELMADTALFKYTGGKNVKDWKFIDRNKIANKIDTLEIEISENSFNNQILVNRNKNRVKIFELVKMGI